MPNRQKKIKNIRNIQHRSKKKAIRAFSAFNYIIDRKIKKIAKRNHRKIIKIEKKCYKG